jgi:hypothetical protein
VSHHILCNACCKSTCTLVEKHFCLVTDQAVSLLFVSLLWPRAEGVSIDLNKPHATDMVLFVVACVASKKL